MNVNQQNNTFQNQNRIVTSHDASALHLISLTAVVLWALAWVSSFTLAGVIHLLPMIAALTGFIGLTLNLESSRARVSSVLQAHIASQQMDYLQG